MSTRISTNQIFQNATNSVAQAREREINSSEKSSTMKEINRPSDNAPGWVQANALKGELQSNETVNRNLSNANRMFSVTDNLLAQVTEGLERAHELAVTASSRSTAGEQGHQVILPEVKAVFDNVLQALNTRYAGRTLLGGFQTTKPAYDRDGNFQGDAGKIEIEMGNGQKLLTNLNPDEVIHGKGLPEGVDVIATFKDLMSGLESGNYETIRSTLPKLLKGVEQMSYGRSQVAARMKGLERALDGNESQAIEQKESISKIEEVDALKAFSDLTRDQTVLRAAMSTSQKILTEDPVQTLFK